MRIWRACVYACVCMYVCVYKGENLGEMAVIGTLSRVMLPSLSRTSCSRRINLMSVLFPHPV